RQERLACRPRVLVNGRHQRPLERWRSGERLDRARQRVGRYAQLLDLGATFGAAREMTLERGLLVRLERAEQEGPDFVLVAVALDGHTVSSPRSPDSWRRSFSSPRRMRPFTVPIGMSSIS